MTRARLVAEHPGTVVRHDDFENFPAGVTPHTTAPLDYLIVALAALLRAVHGAAARSRRSAHFAVARAFWRLVSFLVAARNRVAGAARDPVGLRVERDSCAWNGAGPAGSSGAPDSRASGCARSGMEVAGESFARLGNCERDQLGVGALGFALRAARAAWRIDSLLSRVGEIATDGATASDRLVDSSRHSAPGCGGGTALAGMAGLGAVLSQLVGDHRRVAGRPPDESGLVVLVRRSPPACSHSARARLAAPDDSARHRRSRGAFFLPHSVGGALGLLFRAPLSPHDSGADRHRETEVARRPNDRARPLAASPILG